MNKLKSHFELMQDKMREFIIPDTYKSLDGKIAPMFENNHSDNIKQEIINKRNELFANDMIYLLDGPEQREAQAEAEFDFQALALRTESDKLPVCGEGSPGDVIQANRLLHAATGLATEAGEFLDPIKKLLFYGKPLDEVNLKEEIGDILWYVAIACDALDTDIDTEMRRVIDKLKTRFPNQFTAFDAINRDLKTERSVLERKFFSGETTGE